MPTKWFVVDAEIAAIWLGPFVEHLDGLVDETSFDKEWNSDPNNQTDLTTPPKPSKPKKLTHPLCSLCIFPHHPEKPQIHHKLENHIIITKKSNQKPHPPQNQLCLSSNPNPNQQQQLHLKQSHGVPRVHLPPHNRGTQPRLAELSLRDSGVSRETSDSVDRCPPSSLIDEWERPKTTSPSRRHPHSHSHTYLCSGSRRFRLQQRRSQSQNPTFLEDSNINNNSEDKKPNSLLKLLQSWKREKI